MGAAGGSGVLQREQRLDVPAGEDDRHARQLLGAARPMGARVEHQRGGYAGLGQERQQLVDLLARQALPVQQHQADFLAAGLLTSVFERKQEAKNPYVRLVEVSEDTTDPSAWGVNWAREYDDYKRTSEVTKTMFGGSETLPDEKAQAKPWLTRMFAGYAFAIDYRDRRGHAYMLQDQEQTRRVTERPQP